MKRVLHDFVIDKIAAVDRPCVEHATVTIMKRAEQPVASEAAIAAAKRAVLKLKMDLLKADVVLIEKAWSDAARQASIEARKRHGASLPSTSVRSKVGGKMVTAEVGHHVSFKSGKLAGRIVHIRPSPTGGGHMLTLHSDSGVTEQPARSLFKD